MATLKGYVNKVDNSRKIYSREDIGAMSQADYAQNEKAIDYQMKTIGVPTNKDLKNSSDVVYVSAYKRQDGTAVTDYYRSKPDGGCFGTGTTPTGGDNGGCWGTGTPPVPPSDPSDIIWGNPSDPTDPTDPTNPSISTSNANRLTENIRRMY